MGATGPQGPIGLAGLQGPVYAGLGTTGAVASYVDVNPYASFTFRGRSDNILRSDESKVRAIAEYMRQNPSALITIDGPSQRYTRSVVDALKDAGVAMNRMRSGPYSAPRQENRVDVLVSG